MLTTKAAKKSFEQKLLAKFFFFPSIFSENFLMVWEHQEFKVAFLQLPLFLKGLEIVFEIPQTYPHSPGSNSEPFTSKGESSQRVCRVSATGL